MAINSFTRPTLDTIYKRIKADMESRLQTTTNITRFSFLGITAFVFAGAIHLTYGFLCILADQLFVDTATGMFLDRFGRIYKLPRKAATFATGEVLFSGVDTTVIPAGTEMQNTEGIVYTTISEVTIVSGSAAADIQSETEGAAGNTDEATLQLLFPTTGLDSEVTTTTAPNGGVDLETDDALRARLLQRIQHPPSSGTVNDYERWALETPGVGVAWGLKAEDYKGAGTTGIVIATSDLNVVDPAVKTATQTYIDSVKPEVAAATVEDLERVNTDYEISLTPNTEQFRDAIDQNLDDLHVSEARPGGTILLTHVFDAIAKSGVTDYRVLSIELNGTPVPSGEDITTEGFGVAVFNSVTYSDM